MPARVLLQDFTGVPAVVDLAAMRDAIRKLGGDPKKINPLLPAELVIDHSVQVDKFGAANSFAFNAELEMQRNIERYAFLRWGQKSLRNFRVVPPDTGICHQVNLEYLARVVFSVEQDGKRFAFPDSLVGTDSHTTMVNGLGVFGWGVGGIEAEAAMLGQPLSMLIPAVVGFKLHGRLPEGATATDLVLTVTQMLRKKGVVGKFVEFYGTGLSSLTLPDRATIANMAPEYGATMGFFPVDSETLAYLRFTSRHEDQVKLVEAYTKEQGLFRTDATADPIFSDTLELDLANVVPTMAGPKRPQDSVPLTQAKSAFEKVLTEPAKHASVQNNGDKFELADGSVVIAAITSCTNTSNPSLMLGAGLLAKKAVERGLTVKPWVKTSFAPGSKVVTDYIEKAGLWPFLNELRFNLVGYGCTTCIGNSGPLSDSIGKAIKDNNLVAVSVLSGNRNFEGRINPLCRANYLASPPLVVAYAIAGRMDFDIVNEPIGKDKAGKAGLPARYLADAAGSGSDDAQLGDERNVPQGICGRFHGRRAVARAAGSRRRSLRVGRQIDLHQESAVFRGNAGEAGRDFGFARAARAGRARRLDHDRPHFAGRLDSGGQPRGKISDRARRAAEGFQFVWRAARQSRSDDARHVRQYSPAQSARARHRGRLDRPSAGRQQMTIYDAAMKYREEGVPLLVIAGKEYGSGSSRDWAAKGTILLGVRAVLAESFERIHRSNLVGMGVLPLEFLPGENAKSLGLTGLEIFDFEGLAQNFEPRKKIKVRARDAAGKTKDFTALVRVDTPFEVAYYQHGGILQYVLRQML